MVRLVVEWVLCAETRGKYGCRRGVRAEVRIALPITAFWRLETVCLVQTVRSLAQDGLQMHTFVCAPLHQPPEQGKACSAARCETNTNLCTAEWHSGRI